jgi:UDP-N-acetylmuramate dehydrogenase
MDMAEMVKLENLRGELRLNEPMAKHVSWRAGGAAARTYAPADVDDLAAFLRTLSRTHLRTEGLYFCGLGSNLLVRDGGLKATVVFTHWALRQLELLNTGERDIEFHAGAGIASPKAARFSALHGAEGAEFLAGIPGTLGGALAMNAGCYGGETWELVASVTTIDRDGQLHQRARDEFHIGYRSVQGPAEEWFVSATLRVPRGDGEKSRHKIKDLLSKRIASQPLQQPNAGSVFRNPPGDFAARLIEACGLKGTRIGGAEISRKHSNFIVNVGGASAADIEALIDLAQNTVRERFGVVLEREVRIVGERA